MKTTILLVRHGESLGNRDELFLGHTDLPLSELGHRQAAALASALRGRHIDAVYSSDLSRAMQTVAPAAAERGLTVTPCRGLREIFAGDWEGKRYDDLAVLWPSERGTWKNNIGFACPPNGESVRELYARVEKTLAEIAAANEGRVVLCGTHATPVRATTARLLGLGLEAMATVPWAPNASITTVVFEDGVPTLVGEADASHLEGIATFVPKKI